MLIKKDGRSIYIRDNSFLGQPAYYCYIPGMSEITNIPDDSFSNVFLNFDKYISVLTNLKENSLQQRRKLISAIKEYVAYSPIGDFRVCDYLVYFREHPIAKLTTEEIIELLLNNESSDDFILPLNLDFPHCFQCSDCQFSKECNFPAIKKIWESIRTKMDLFYGNR